MFTVNSKKLSQPIHGAQFYGRKRGGMHNGSWPLHSVIILNNTCTLSFSARAQPDKGGDRLRWVHSMCCKRCIFKLFTIFI